MGVDGGGAGRVAGRQDLELHELDGADGARVEVEVDWAPVSARLVGLDGRRVMVPLGLVELVYDEHGELDGAIVRLPAVQVPA